jgi:hypothetical protein
MIIGDPNQPLSGWTLAAGQSVRVWWYGYGGDDPYYFGFAIPPAYPQASDRVVTDNHCVEYVEGWDSGRLTGWLYSANVHVEPSIDFGDPATFRFQIGQLA